MVYQSSPDSGMVHLGVAIITREIVNVDVIPDPNPNPNPRSSLRFIAFYWYIYCIVN